MTIRFTGEDRDLRYQLVVRDYGELSREWGTWVHTMVRGRDARKEIGRYPLWWYEFIIDQYPTYNVRASAYIGLVYALINETDTWHASRAERSRQLKRVFASMMRQSHHHEIEQCLFGPLLGHRGTYTAMKPYMDVVRWLRGELSIKIDKDSTADILAKSALERRVADLIDYANVAERRTRPKTGRKRSANTKRINVQSHDHY